MDVSYIVRLSGIYHYLGLPKGLEQELELSFSKFGIVSECPYNRLYGTYLKVEKSALLASRKSLKHDLELLLGLYGMKICCGPYGDYYR